MIHRRIFISAVAAPHPSSSHFDFQVALLQRLRDAGYELEQFGVSGSALGLEWSHDAVERVMRRCVGVLVLGVGVVRRPFPDGLGFAYLPAERHYEGALATSLGLPLLVVKESFTADGGVLSAGTQRAIIEMPHQADDARVAAKVGHWLEEIGRRRDVFLAYCAKSRDLADRIHSRLAHAGAHVRDWAIDFRPGQTILAEIEAARADCTGGVFLFTEDDVIEGQEGAAAPRDNVIFEAGYFIAAKGAQRCLIVRVGKAKMPADLGGAIYLHMDSPSNLVEIEARLADFVSEQL